MEPRIHYDFADRKNEFNCNNVVYVSCNLHTSLICLARILFQ